MQTVTSADGTKIAYDREGAGPALILVGGAFSYRTFPMLVKLSADLAATFTVYSYDRRGRGDSTDTQPYAVEREVEDLQALIEVAGGSADVWGISSGSILSLYAAAAGIGVRKVAAYQPPLRVDASVRLPPADFEQHLGTLVADGRRSEAVRYMMTKGMGAPGFAVGIMRVMPVWRRLTDLAHTLPYDVALLGDKVYGRPLSADDWADVKVPVLTIAGGRAPAGLRAAAEQLAEVLPDGRYQVLPGQSHNVAPRALVPVLTEFFRS